MWTNFFQIFHLSLFGLTYYIAVGIHVLFYYSYDKIQEIKVGFNFFQSSFGINYHESNMIIAGINLLPLLIFIFFNKKIESINRKGDLCYQ